MASFPQGNEGNDNARMIVENIAADKTCQISGWLHKFLTNIVSTVPVAGNRNDMLYYVLML